MPNWHEIGQELGISGSTFDIVRRKYLKKLSEYTTRNTIIYYSGWLQKSGINGIINALIHAVIMFLIMFTIKKIGDIMFKKESMGGGDIKLMFIYGLVLGWPTSCMSIGLAAFIGLPVSLILLKKNNNHEIPFGPFLAVSAIILVLCKIDINFLIDILTIK